MAGQETSKSVLPNPSTLSGRNLKSQSLISPPVSPSHNPTPLTLTLSTLLKINGQLLSTISHSGMLPRSMLAQFLPTLNTC